MRRVHRSPRTSRPLGDGAVLVVVPPCGHTSRLYHSHLIFNSILDLFFFFSLFKVYSFAYEYKYTYLTLLLYPADHPIAALAVICLSVFVISVDATIVNVALPYVVALTGRLTPRKLQWIVDAYTLVMSGLLLSVGSLSDRYGRRGRPSAGLAVICDHLCRCGAG